MRLYICQSSKLSYLINEDWHANHWHCVVNGLHDAVHAAVGDEQNQLRVGQDGLKKRFSFEPHFKLNVW